MVVGPRDQASFGAVMCQQPHFRAVAVIASTLPMRAERSAERRDEDVRPMLLASCRIKNRHGVAGPVDEQLLAGKMRLAHRRRDAVPPVAVALAEPAIGVALRVLSAVLLPEQRQR